MGRAIPCSGTCKNGHTTSCDGDLDMYGRPKLTWRGTCPTEGCTEHLIARRIKNVAGSPTTGQPSNPPPARAPTAPASPAAPPPATPARAKRTVRKVTSYREPQPRTRVPSRRASEPAGVPATAPVPAVAEPAAPAEPVSEPGEPAKAGHVPGRARPHRRFSLSGPDVRDSDGWVVPNIY